jgi:hypothetical protein
MEKKYSQFSKTGLERRDLLSLAKMLLGIKKSRKRYKLLAASSREIFTSAIFVYFCVILGDKFLLFFVSLQAHCSIF